VCEKSKENNEFYGDPQTTKIFEEIQSRSLPTNEILGENSVYELIGVEKSTGKDKRVGRLKTKIGEMTVVDEFNKKKIIVEILQCYIPRRNISVEKVKQEFASKAR
jgi:hypothetical protein